MQKLSNTVILDSKTIPKYTKLDTVLYLSYLKPVRHKLQELHLIDRGYEEKNAAFTLAETLITLTILGVVAAITVPSLINKQTESANRTKLKKAMAVYEKALSQMIIENDIKGDLYSEFPKNDCSKTTEYFKKVETTSSDCRFRTADRIWWDISDIKYPVISLKDQITTQAESAAIKAKADSIEKDKTSFVMVGEIKDGIVRINDKGVTTATPDKNYLDKLYGFMNNASSGVVDTPTIDRSRACSDDTKNGGGNYVSCINNDYLDEDCTDDDFCNGYFKIYDAEGNNREIYCQYSGEDGIDWMHENYSPSCTIVDNKLTVDPSIAE